MAATVVWQSTVASRTFRLVRPDVSAVIMEELNSTDAMGVPRWQVPAPIDPAIVALMLDSKKAP